MSGYVRHLAAKLDAEPEFTNSLREEIAKRRAELAGATGGHARVPEATAGLLTGFRQFLEYAVTAGACSADDAQTQMTRIRTALLRVAASQTAYAKGMAVAEIYLRALASALIGGAAHLADQETGREPNEPERWGWEPYPGGDGGTVYHPRGKCVGWLSRSGEVYLHPDSAYAVARDHAARVAEPLATTKVTIHKRLREGGHLAATGEDGRATVGRRITGRLKRVIHIRADRITGDGE